MSATTLCPTCNTRFKITQAQLDAHQGLVRCGCCQAVFNAKEHLQDDAPSPQLDLPMLAAEAAAAKIAPPEPIAAPAPQEESTSGQEPAVEAAQPIARAQKITFAQAPEARLARKKRAWPWAAGSLLLLLVLLAQVAYFFRVELAASQPGLKPALLSYCGLLQCTVPLPQKADLMSIESSELEADPAQSSVIALNALLRNHAPYAQAYPDLELTLTDVQEKALARHTFRPAEYLKPDEDEKQGLAANRELGVKLNLDTTDLKPSGYRLFLYYPQ